MGGQVESGRGLQKRRRQLGARRDHLLAVVENGQASRFARSSEGSEMSESQRPAAGEPTTLCA
jgi:hypothetical protein